jgi:hypothetical protein
MTGHKDLTPEAVAALSRPTRRVLRQTCKRAVTQQATSAPYVLTWPADLTAEALVAQYQIVTLLEMSGAIETEATSAGRFRCHVTPETWDTLQAGLRLAAQRLQKSVRFTEAPYDLAIRLGWGLRTQTGFRWRHPDDRILHLLQDLLADRLRGADLHQHYPAPWQHTSRESLLDLLQVRVKEHAHAFIVYPR